MEAREFSIFTDHKPLVYALAQNPDKASPRQARQLSFIAQFSCKIYYLLGADNNVADALPRINSFRLPTQFDVLELAAEQERETKSWRDR